MREYQQTAEVNHHPPQRQAVSQSMDEPFLVCGCLLWLQSELSGCPNVHFGRQYRVESLHSETTVTRHKSRSIDERISADSRSQPSSTTKASNQPTHGRTLFVSLTSALASIRV